MNYLGGYRNGFAFALTGPRCRGQGRPARRADVLPVPRWPRPLRPGTHPADTQRQGGPRNQRGGGGPVQGDRQGPRRAQGGSCVRQRRHRVRAVLHPRVLRSVGRAGRCVALRRVLAGADPLRTGAPDGGDPRRRIHGGRQHRRQGWRGALSGPGGSRCRARQTGPPSRVPWERSSAPGPATRAATPTSGCSPARPRAYAWLERFLTAERFTELLPDTARYAVDRYPLPNLWSINFVVRGLLEEGVAASSRQDGQAKGFGEYLRAKYADIPEALLA